ncbi:hypothetical protein [Mycoplasma struthionis]|uniref:Uncharacterized protein n=1 Tax=Mycoplasma struthionis TaxID=538220 RepID=A0A3G8LG02_9MOLU|nr:hypothetical protein [Mycoplasma struthionis]AZG68431.1 hypothetical protein EGN60_00350 [Mycoplasma struthionis]
MVSNFLNSLKKSFNLAFDKLLIFNFVRLFRYSAIATSLSEPPNSSNIVLGTLLNTSCSKLNFQLIDSK